MESLANWLEGHLLTCPVKAIWHVDCPGCGFQRACIALIRGDLGSAWDAYPPLFPFLLMLVVLFVTLKYRNRIKIHYLAASVGVTCLFITVHYLAKMF